MTEQSGQYRATYECDQRAQLYTECVKLLLGARTALQIYAGYKTTRTHHNCTDTDIVTQTLTHK